MSYKRFYDDEGFTGNRQKMAMIEDEKSFAAELLDRDEGCHLCGYEGILQLTKKGWKCPQCRKILIPYDE